MKNSIIAANRIQYSVEVINKEATKYLTKNLTRGIGDERNGYLFNIHLEITLHCPITSVKYSNEYPTDLKSVTRIVIDFKAGFFEFFSDSETDNSMVTEIYLADYDQRSILFNDYFSTEYDHCFASDLDSVHHAMLYLFEPSIIKSQDYNWNKNEYYIYEYFPLRFFDEEVFYRTLMNENEEFDKILKGQSPVQITHYFNNAELGTIIMEARGSKSFIGATESYTIGYKTFVQMAIELSMSSNKTMQNGQKSFKTKLYFEGNCAIKLFKYPVRPENNIINSEINFIAFRENNGIELLLSDYHHIHLDLDDIEVSVKDLYKPIKEVFEPLWMDVSKNSDKQEYIMLFNQSGKELLDYMFNINQV
jgi:hypothetical protein